MFPVSSKARLLMVTEPEPAAAHENDQLVVPVACFQVAPPSVDTSTPATRPPPVSAAVPVMVTAVPAANEAPAAGAEIVDVGGAVSVEAVAAVSPGCRL